MRWYELEEGDVLLPKSDGFTFLILEKDEHYVIKWVNIELSMRGMTKTLEDAAAGYDVVASYIVLRGSEEFK